MAKAWIPNYAPGVYRGETSAQPDAARLALISFDAAMKSNLSVGPPLELAIYRAETFAFARHLLLDAESPLLRDVCEAWNSKLTEAFHSLPRFNWEPG